jgi:hypothetical protein
MSSKQKHISLIAILIAVCGLFLWFRYDPDAQHDERAIEGRKMPGRSMTEGPRATGTDILGSDAAIDDFLASRYAREDAAALLRKARGSSDRNEISAGVSAALKCREIFSSLPLSLQSSQETVTLKRAVAARRVVNRYCTGFIGHDEEFRDLADLAKRGAELGSPSMTAVDIVSRAGAPDANPAFDPRLCRVVTESATDAEALRPLIPILTNRQRETLFGQQYSHQLRVTFSKALDLAICRIGNDCLADSWTAIRVCATNGYCQVDDVMASMLRTMSTQESEEVNILSTKIVQTIKNGDCKSLTQ